MAVAGGQHVEADYASKARSVTRIWQVGHSRGAWSLGSRAELDHGHDLLSCALLNGLLVDGPPHGVVDREHPLAGVEVFDVEAAIGCDGHGEIVQQRTALEGIPGESRGQGRNRANSEE
jgi:hypothetical protein